MTLPVSLALDEAQKAMDSIERRLNLASIYKEGYDGTEEYGCKSAIDQ